LNFRVRLIEKIRQKKSLVCFGIDPDVESEFFPRYVLEYNKPKLEFAKMILDEVEDKIPIIKINTRYFFIDEMDQLKSIVQYAHTKDLEVIGDCKENDIGHSMSMAYKKHFLGFKYDAITVNGYFGSEGVIGTTERPIFKKWFDQGKGLFVLIKTSNLSGAEVQDLKIVETSNGQNNKNEIPLYNYLAQLVEKWSSKYDFCIGGVVGATYPDQLKIIRNLISGVLLLPGYGTQGGSAENIKYCVKGEKFSIINSSRSIMYAYAKKYRGQFNPNDFPKASRKYIEEMIQNINKCVKF